MILMQTLKIINDYKVQYFKTSMFINDSCITDIWFENLAEILRYARPNFRYLS